MIPWWGRVFAAEIEMLQWLVLPSEQEEMLTHDLGSAAGAEAFVAKLNADDARNLGSADWRLPTVDELKSLVGTDAAPLNGWYWAHTDCKGRTRNSWNVGFVRGSEGCSRPDLVFGHVRPVRAVPGN